MFDDRTDDDRAQADDEDAQSGDGEGRGSAPRRRRRSRSGGGARSGGRSGNGGSEITVDADPRIASRRPARTNASAQQASEESEQHDTGRGGNGARSAAEADSADEPKAASRSASASGRRRGGSARSGGSSSDPGVAELVEALADMRETVERFARRERVGVFVDVPNLLYGAERVEEQVDMGRLLTHLTRGRDLIRATAYAPVSDNPAEPVERQKFVAPFVPHGYRIVTKPLKRFQDGSIKGNFDVEMAVDIVTMSERLDVISIVSGDADFAKAVEYVQQKGVRVEVVAFAGSSSIEMRALADEFIEVGAILEELRPRRR